MSPSSINVSWSTPIRNGDTLTEYIVNITTLRAFDAPFTGLGYGSPETSASSSSSSSESGTGSAEKAKVKRTEAGVDHSGDSYIQAHAHSILSRNSSGKAFSTSSSLDENAEDKVEAKMMQIKVSIVN